MSNDPTIDLRFQTTGVKQVVKDIEQVVVTQKDAEESAATVVDQAEERKRQALERTKRLKAAAEEINKREQQGAADTAAAIVEAEEKKQQAVAETSDAEQREAEIRRKIYEEDTRISNAAAAAYVAQQQKIKDEARARREARLAQQEAVTKPENNPMASGVTPMTAAEIEKEDAARKAANAEILLGLKRKEAAIETERLAAAERKATTEKEREADVQEAMNRQALRARGQMGKLPTMPVAGGAAGGGSEADPSDATGLKGLLRGTSMGDVAANVAPYAAIALAARKAVGEVAELAKKQAEIDPAWAKEYATELKLLASLQDPIGELMETLAGGPKKAQEEMVKAIAYAKDARTAYLELKKTEEDRKKAIEERTIKTQLEQELTANENLSKSIERQIQLLKQRRDADVAIADNAADTKIAQIRAGAGTDAEKATQVAALEAEKRQRAYQNALADGATETAIAQAKVNELNGTLQVWQGALDAASIRLVDAQLKLEKFNETHPSRLGKDPTQKERDDFAIAESDRAGMRADIGKARGDVNSTTDQRNGIQNQLNEAQANLEQLLKEQAISNEKLLSDFSNGQQQAAIALGTSLNDQARAFQDKIKQIDADNAARGIESDNLLKGAIQTMSEILKDGIVDPTEIQKFRNAFTEVMNSRAALDREIYSQLAKMQGAYNQLLIEYRNLKAQRNQ
ncbi:hypothetical protein [Luteolibacter sp. LG18]|uniref:hypothetical protein n=1 Tax=Luteolibacter sp. LG18 TaxID=2819286 RepID=UPI002B28A429|nr:hypothetical protein llg_06940 [Luteolibacter sp. LG18]BCU79677.1 hypothetical protein llg_43920 [Luteolibacter sp. LG18]